MAIFGKEYEKVQKKLYRDSLMAGFRKREVIDLCADADLADVSVEQRFITHLDIVKRSGNWKQCDESLLAKEESDFMERFARRHYIAR